MKNALTNNYDKICEQVKQALTICLLNADLVLAQETLSQQGKELIETIKKQIWRIDRELKKGESQNEKIKELSAKSQNPNESYPGKET